MSSFVWKKNLLICNYKLFTNIKCLFFAQHMHGGSCFVSKSHPFHHGNSPPCRTVASCFSCDPFLALNTKQAARLLTKVTESICRYWLKIQLHYLRVGKLTSSHLAQPSWRVGPCTGWCRSTVQGWGKLTIQCDGSEHWWVSSVPPLFS